jgi:hypothetical protein
MLKKPRKRRTQTMAEKSTAGGKLFVWQGVMGKAFTYAPSPNVWATLVEQDGKWIMAVKLDGQKFHGERETLEAAFKATANLIYKHARPYWLQMDARGVTKFFDDFLLPS